jgi:outer membrane protein OmpA-like peptidoglycan-associated protein/tetratricopeptide (TPR) repeat protein
MRHPLKYMLILAGIIFALSDNILLAQNVSKKSVRKAERYFMNAKFDEAAALFSELADKDPKNFDFNFKAGVSWFYSLNTYNRVKGLPYLEAAHKVNAPDTVPELYYYLGRTYHIVNRFDDAIGAYSMLKDYIQTYSGDTVDVNEVKQYIEMARNGKEMIKNPVNVIITNLGPEVNSQYMEYAPTLPADESFIVFTSRREGTTGGNKDDDDLYYEDIYIAKKSGDKWQQAQNGGTNLNSKKHDASVAVSPDGKRLYLYRAHDIWVSTREGDSWGKPVKLLPDVNSRSYEPSITISLDEKTIYFVSERKGGQGGKDIWKSTKLEDGKWSSAENLGPGINTPFDEDSPFITPDGNTLYFSSQGHNSMGGLDVFKATMDNGRWTSPENLGYPINTSWDDVFYVLNTSSNNAYYSTIKDDTYGDYDIYLVTPPKPTEPVKPKKKKVRLIFISNIVSTKGSNGTARIVSQEDTIPLFEDLLTGRIYSIDSVQTGKTYTTAVYDKRTGKERKISFTVPENSDGTIYQEVLSEEVKDKKGKVTEIRTTFYNAIFNTDSVIADDQELSMLSTSDWAAKYSRLVRKIDTNKTKLNFKVYSFIDKIPDVLASGQDGNTQQGQAGTETWGGKRDSLRFTPITFDYQKAQLTGETMRSLNAIYEFMAANKDAKIEIHGYTDFKGSDIYNLDLSKQRANVVMNYLKNKGIPVTRMKVIAHGEADPVAPNQNPDGSDNPSGREKNRRVEFIVVTPQ